MNLRMGDGVLGKSLFVQDYIEKKKNDYQLDRRDNLCVLTKTNGSISHISFNVDWGREAESLVIQLWEGSETEPLATVVGKTEPDSDDHPVNATAKQRKTDATLEPTSPLPLARQAGQNSDARPVDTPLWDKFLQNLELANDNEAGGDFIEFIQNHCFSGDLLWKDTDGNWVDKAIPLAVKMETLVEAVWQRRQLAHEHLFCKGVYVNDYELELGDTDMKTLWPLWIPEQRILIMCAMGGGPGHKNGA